MENHGSGLSVILKSENMPFFITAIIAILGWSLTHIVDRLIKSPIIEYKIIERIEGKQIKSVYQFTNITRDRLFKNIEFQLLLDNPSTGNFFIEDECFLQIPPPLNIKGKEKKGLSYFNFRVDALHPNCSIRAVVKISGDNKPTVHFITYENKDNKTQPIMLVSNSFDTYLIKNELELIKYLILIWLFILFCYFSYYYLIMRE